MPDKFHATVQRQEGGLLIKLAGIIDEDNHLVELADKVGTGRALIDLGEIDRINSCGTRDWVNWIAQLESRGVQPVLVACSPAIVAQLNLVKNFGGGAIVKSFYVPYHCLECDQEKVSLVEVADFGPPPHVPPICRCDECDSVMDFDDMPDAYFSFLTAKHRSSAEELDKEIARGSRSSLKARTRTSQPVLASRASTPSLSAFQRPSQSTPSIGTAVQPRADPTPASPAKPTVTVVPPRISRLVFILVAMLFAAIAVLAYLLA